MNKTSLVGHACFYRWNYGISVIPMWNKKPAIKWKAYQERRANLSEILSWDMNGIAMVTGKISGICVIDCDDTDSARWWYKNRPRCPMVKTKRGVHFLYRYPGDRVQNATKISNGKATWDVRGEGGYTVLPPSRGYKWLETISQSGTPEFNMNWRPTTQVGSSNEVVDGEKYIANITAVAGQGGHNATFRAACKLRDSGLSEGEALLAMIKWNETNADPPWSEGDLLHKVRSAFRGR